jgi:SAM-dependent methyltransferase
MLYQPQAVKTYYDNYGTREWERLEQTLQGRIRYAIHRHFLDKYVPQGGRVLDVGCGPRRFALDLARRGACLTLVDISQKQLDMAHAHLEAAGLLDRLQACHCLDMVDMPELENESFAAVVCYGAALSYTYDRYETALQELARLLSPGGCLLISVASLFGNMRLIGPYDGLAFLEQPDVHIDWQAVLSGAGMVLTRPGSDEFHQPLALFTSYGLRQALEKVGLQVVEMAAANPVVSEGAKIPGIESSLQAGATLTELELALCSQPGLVDSGEHLLAVACKP